MSKYDDLWIYIQKSKEPFIIMPFKEICEIAGIPIDHSFLNYKKELEQYGWKVDKISLKEQNVIFKKII